MALAWPVALGIGGVLGWVLKPTKTKTEIYAVDKNGYRERVPYVPAVKPQDGDPHPTDPSLRWSQFHDKWKHYGKP